MSRSKSKWRNLSFLLPPNLSVLLLSLRKLVGEVLEGGEGLLQLVVDVLLPRRDLLQRLRNSWKSVVCYL